MIEFLRTVQCSYGQDSFLRSYALAVFLHILVQALICLREAYRFQFVYVLRLYDEAPIIRYIPMTHILHSYVPYSISDAMMMHVARCVAQSQVKSAQIYLAHSLWLHLILFAITSVAICLTLQEHFNLALVLANQLLTTFADIFCYLLMALGRHGMYGIFQLLRAAVSFFYLRLTALKMEGHDVGQVARALQFSQLADALPCVLFSFIFLIPEFHLQPVMPRFYSFFPINLNVMGKIIQLMIPIFLSKSYFLVALYEYSLEATNTQVTFKQQYLSVIESCGTYFYIYLSSTGARIIRQPSLCYLSYLYKPKAQVSLCQLMVLFAFLVQLVNLMIIGYFIDIIMEICQIAFTNSLFISTSLIVINDCMLMLLLLKDRYFSALVISFLQPLIIGALLFISQIGKYTIAIVDKVAQIIIAYSIALYLLNMCVYISDCRLQSKEEQNKAEAFAAKWE